MSGLALPVVRLVRLPLVSAAAGLVAGTLALGLGLRLTMRVVALLNTEDFVFTENGNVVGEITLGGTLLVVAAGGFVGALFGLAFAVGRSWLPGHGAARGTVFGALLAVGLGAPVLVDGESIDFALLDGDAIAVPLLLACPVLYGAILGAAVDRIAPDDPRVLRSRPVRIVGTVLVAVVALAGLVRLVDAIVELAG